MTADCANPKYPLPSSCLDDPHTFLPTDHYSILSLYTMVRPLVTVVQWLSSSASFTNTLGGQKKKVGGRKAGALFLELPSLKGRIRVCLYLKVSVFNFSSFFLKSSAHKDCSGRLTNDDGDGEHAIPQDTTILRRWKRQANLLGIEDLYKNTAPYFLIM